MKKRNIHLDKFLTFEVSSFVIHHVLSDAGRGKGSLANKNETARWQAQSLSRLIVYRPALHQELGWTALTAEYAVALVD